MRFELFNRLAVLLLLVLGIPFSSHGQEAAGGGGSIADDKKARELIEAGDIRYENKEAAAALDLYKAAIDRYPTSRWRFLAHLKLGKHFLKERTYEPALEQFRRALAPEDTDPQLRGDASLQLGIAFYDSRKYPEAFAALREVIKNFPGTSYCNDAYYYIGQAHFQLGHYEMAIEAYNNVGTSLDPTADEVKKVEAGKRLFIRVDDKDFTGQGEDPNTEVTLKAASGDTEKVVCVPSAGSPSILIGSIRTQLGKPKPGDGILEVIGTDTITVSYTDKHTADGHLNVGRTNQIKVVGDGKVRVVDGAYEDEVGAAALGKPCFISVQDPDRDVSDGADSVEVVVRIKRLIEEEDSTNAVKEAKTGASTPADVEEKPEPIFQVIAEKKLALVEKANEPAPAPVHSGVFTGSILVPKEGAEPKDAFQARVGDILEVEYQDDLSLSPKPEKRKTTAKIIEGNLNPLTVAEVQISDEDLRFRTTLKTAEALRNIGNIYKDLGLARQANDKFAQSLHEVESIDRKSGVLSQTQLEQTYVQLWKTYYAMDDLDNATLICTQLQQRFPNSPFVDDALMLMGQVSQKKGAYQEAIGVYRRLVAIKNSSMGASAQYSIGECYEALGAQNAANYDEAFLAFKTCFEKYPNSGYAGDSLSKMADYYYAKEDFNHAIDLYEEALALYQDSKFLDVILFNYGKCLYKMKKIPEATARFNQVISSCPNSKLVPQAKKIVEALEEKAGG